MSGLENPDVDCHAKTSSRSLVLEGTPLDTRAMKSRPALGALIGLAAGITLVGLLIVLPAALQGSYYEITDPLVIMGVPLLVIGASIGALVGALGRRSVTEVHAEPMRWPFALPVAGITVALVASLLAGWLLLWGVGALDTPPLWIT